MRIYNHPHTILLPLLLFLSTYIQHTHGAIQSVEIGVDGEIISQTLDDHPILPDLNQKETETPKEEQEPEKEPEKEAPAPPHPNALEVIFENQSGHPVDLFWDDSKEGVLQSALDHTNQITINTFLGHRFYFTPRNATTHKGEDRLYEVTMEEHTGLVTLYDPKTMSERGKEFERKKAIWMKEYYQRTGRRWQNYYPREPITFHYHSVENTGDVIEATSDRSKFRICTENDLSEDDIARLNSMESEWSGPKITQPCKEDPEGEGCSLERLPPGFQSENEKLFYGRMNGTDYCRDKIGIDEVNDGSVEVDPSATSSLLKWDIKNLCNHGPFAFRVLDFLSEAEMEHIKTLGQFIGLKRSTVSEEALQTVDRTSQTVWIERSKSFIVDNVVRRIADVVKVPQDRLFLNASSESLQLVHYFGGELYKAHVDYGTDRPHNRFITFLMYLSEVTEGGNTSFPKADAKCLDENGYLGVQPIKGSVMFFYNLFPDGNVDTKTQHYAEPPVDSEKWMTNLWIWDYVFTR